MFNCSNNTDYPDNVPGAGTRWDWGAFTTQTQLGIESENPALYKRTNPQRRVPTISGARVIPFDAKAECLPS